MRTFVFIFVCVLLMWGFFSCLDGTTRRSYNRAQNVPVTTSSTDASVTFDAAAKNGLDLEALLPIVKRVANAEELERELNKPDGINNLDLNEDEQVDYIKVDEFGGRDNWGFSLTTEPAPGEVQEIATIQLERNQEQANIQVMGSPNIYGPGTGFMATSMVTDLLILGWLMDFDRPRWRSSYRYGSYPSYYRSYRPVGYRNYSSRVSSYKSGVSSTRITSPRITQTGNPNAGKTAASGIKKSLAQPTSAQRSFQARNPSKAVRSGGFGRGSQQANTSSRSSSRSNATPSRSARSSSSSRGFGGRGK